MAACSLLGGMTAHCLLGLGESDSTLLLLLISGLSDELLISSLLVLWLDLGI